MQDRSKQLADEKHLIEAMANTSIGKSKLWPLALEIYKAVGLVELTASLQVDADTFRLKGRDEENPLLLLTFSLENETGWAMGRPQSDVVTTMEFGIHNKRELLVATHALTVARKIVELRRMVAAWSDDLGETDRECILRELAGILADLNSLFALPGDDPEGEA